MNLVLRAYHQGDLLLVETPEQDPYPGWAEMVERCASGLRTIELDGMPLVCFGFFRLMPGVVDSLAVVDRVRAAGHGRELAKLIAAQSLEWMRDTWTHRVQATCSPSDTAARVFLRAIGYRQEGLLEAGAEDGSDLLQFKMIRREFINGQISSQTTRPAESSGPSGCVGGES